MVAPAVVTGNHSRGRSPSDAPRPRAAVRAVKPPARQPTAPASSLPRSGLGFLHCGQWGCPGAPRVRTGLGPAPAAPQVRAPAPGSGEPHPTPGAAPKRAAWEFTGRLHGNRLSAQTPAPASRSRA